MRRGNMRRLILVLFIAQAVMACAIVGQKGENQQPEEYVLSEKDQISPDSVDLEMIYEENRGLRVLKENALTFHDYYRGAVQRKEDAEMLLEKGEFSKAESLFLESNKWLVVVLKIKGDDDINLPVYHSTAIRYMPNFLMGDNNYKLAMMSDKQGLALEAAAYYESALELLKKSIAAKPCTLVIKRSKEVERRLEYLKYDIFMIFSMKRSEK